MRNIYKDVIACFKLHRRDTALINEIIKFCLENNLEFSCTRSLDHRFANIKIINEFTKGLASDLGSLLDKKFPMINYHVYEEYAYDTFED